MTDEIDPELAAHLGALDTDEDDAGHPPKPSAKLRVAAPSAVEFHRGDEVELARALVDDLTARGPTVCCAGDVHTYRPSEGVFRPLSEAELSCEVQKYAGVPVTSDKGKPLKMRASQVAGAVKLARARIDDPAFFASAPAGLAFRNGFVVVSESGDVRLLPHSADHRARVAYPFDYEDRPSVEWLKFLEALFLRDDDRAEKIALIGEFFGACLLGFAPRFNRCVLSVAEGGAGRSTLLEIVRAAFPRGTCSAIAPQKLSGEGPADYYRAQLAGALCNMVSELPETEILQSSGFKSIVTGDWVGARHPAGRAFDYQPRAGHFFAANPPLPFVADQSEGFWRRWIVLPFGRAFHKEGPDLGIADRIVERELPAVVAWLVTQGARLLRQGAYTVPASHERALADWRRNTNVVALFVAEATEPEEGKGYPAADLYAAFQRWCQANGHRRVLASNTFGARLRALGIEPTRDKAARRYPIRPRARELGAYPVTGDDRE